VEDPVCAGRDDVFLREHLHGIGEGMEQPHQSKAEDARTVRSDAILNDGRLLALDPGMQPGEVQDTEEYDAHQRQFNEQVYHHWRIDIP
jgi:hypothetical protein